MSFEKSQHLQANLGPGPGLGRSTDLAGNFIYFVSRSYDEISHREPKEYGRAPRRTVEDQPSGYVDADFYSQTYTGGVPTVINKPGRSLYTTMDAGMGGGAGDSSLHEAMVDNAPSSGSPVTTSSGTRR